jgi:putative nucleotidyltransferase with HDIG domain
VTLIQKITTGGREVQPSAFRLHLYPWIALALAMAVLLCGCAQQKQPLPSAVRGIVDLSAWDFSSQGPAGLTGEWEFYWNRFLSPEDFRTKQLPGAVEYISMPGFWNGRATSGIRLPGHGFATMRLTVRLGDRQTLFTMKIPHMYTAYRLWVNGKPVSSNGITGTDAVHETPQFLPKIIILTPESGILELLVQISNFHHPKGGMWAPIQLGQETQIISMQRHLDWFNIFLLGGLILMTVYHISIFLMRKSDRASLFFGILCLIIALRVIFEGDRLIIELLPWISWEINEKISYLTFYSPPFIISLYIYYLFPDIYSRTMVRINTATGLVFCCIVIVLTSQNYYYTRYAFDANLAFWSVYGIYVIVRAVMMKKEGAAYLIGGTVFLMTAVCIDVLYHERLIAFGNVTSVGVFIFTISQAMFLSDRSSKALNRIEILSSEKANLFSSSIDIITSILLASSTRLYEFTQTVARVSVMLARRIGIPADGIEEIRIAALLHDIGMMGVPDDLASSPYRISDTERQIIEDHPRKSIDIIDALKELAGVRLIIAQHHERYNGSGYPSRLAGNDIVIGARIIGLVDDSVSMLGRREFQVEDKKNMIISELARQKGVLYDPDLVDTLIQLIEKKNLVYIINENDIRHNKRGDVSEWVFPSNVNYEISVVEKVVAEMKSRAPVSAELSYLIASGLGETIRNAIIHGNKYDESKRVTVSFSVRDSKNRKLLELRVSDQGSGMDVTRYNHYKESRVKLYDIMREMKQFISSLESAGTQDGLAGLNRKLQGFLMDNYINYNRYRHIDAPEGTGGIGLIQVMQTFDNVDFHHIIANHTISGMEVVLKKFID